MPDKIIGDLSPVLICQLPASKLLDPVTHILATTMTVSINSSYTYYAKRQVGGVEENHII